MWGNDHPTIRPNSNFDAEASAEKLKGAMQGLGTSEGEIVEVLASHSSAQREEIEQFYKQAYGQDLVDDLKGELGGTFEDICVAMLNPPRLYDAKQLNRALSGAGTDEGTIIEILCARSDEQIAEIKEKFNAEFEKDLEEAVKGDLGGNLERFMVSLLNANRENGWDVDYGQVEEDAQKLFDAGAAELGTDESVFNQILCTRNYNQLQKTFKKYEELAGRKLVEDIESECTGTLELAYKTLVKFVKDEEEFYADRIQDAVIGTGTDEQQLIRIIVGRSEIDLGDIKQIYEQKYERTVTEAIESDCGGDFKNMLVAIVNGNC